MVELVRELHDLHAGGQVQHALARALGSDPEAVVKMCNLPLLAGENIGTSFVVPA